MLSLRKKIAKLVGFKQIDEAIFPIEKNFSGNIFERIKDLREALNECSDKTILDFGSNMGLIAYEFARNGASKVDGLDNNKNQVKFANQLFKFIPVEGNFYQANLTKDLVPLFSKYNLDKYYDMVLYLGMYHHLAKQSSQQKAKENLKRLTISAKDWLIV